jgi:hypothetical protein
VEARDTSIRQHEFVAPIRPDSDALTFELNGIILAANAHFVLHGDTASLDMAKAIVRRRLAIPPT